MTIAGRCLVASCLVLLLGAVAPRLGPGAKPGARLIPGVAAQMAAAKPPVAQAYSLPPEKLAKAVALGRIRTALDLGGGLWGLVVLWLLLASRAAAGLAAWAERVFRRRWMQGLLFFAAFVAITSLAGLPLYVFGHVASRYYGISVQGWASWLAEMAKSLGLSVLVGAPVLLLFHWIASISPRRYWVWGWLASIPLLLVSVLAEPLIEPLFDTYEPLAAHYPALTARLETVAARTGTLIPPQRMFLMKASEKTNGLNAYVSGIGVTKRIVVWDTTAGRIPDDEILFIFAHESGHYVLHHIPQGIAGTVVALFFVFWACAALAEGMARRFGVRWRLGDAGTTAAPFESRQGFVVLLLAISMASFVLEPASNAFSRHFEHQADVYGQEAIHGLVPDPRKTAVAAFDALGEAWLEDPDPNPFLEFWEFSHPSVKTRANFAAQYDPWASGGRGEFFER